MLIGDGSTLLSKKAFTQGVAMVHALLLFSVFIPPIMLCIQMASNSDLHYFVGTGVAQLAYVVVLFILLLPMGHFFTKFSPALFLLSVWIPAFAFAGIGFYYWNAAHTAAWQLQSTDCVHFPAQGKLQISYNEAQELYLACSKFMTTSIETCPQYGSVYGESPADFNYLKGLESRFQCSGVCSSAVRLWDQPGVSAPACSLFIAEWVRGAQGSATFVMWYDVIIVLASIPVFIVLLDSFFKDYYNPLLRPGLTSRS